jgi:hypothetical protein
MSVGVNSQIDYETVNGVGIWTVDDLNAALESGTLEDGEQHFRDHASGPSMSGCVVCIEKTDGVTGETLGHVNDQWTTLAEETGIDRVAYVADGLTRLAVANKNEASTADIRSFEERDDAVAWAAEA